MAKDLFGNDMPIKEEKNAKQIYKDYISSSRWKRLRNEKINQVGGICECCGISKFSAKLEVHHKTYENFGKEKLSDLLVLCLDCHKLADKNRKFEVQMANYQKRLNAWAIKVYGERWYERPGVEIVEDNFDQWTAPQKDDE